MQALQQQQHQLPSSLAQQQRRQQQWRRCAPATSARRTAAAAASQRSPQSSAGPAASVLITQQGPFTWGSCVSSKPTVQSAVQDAVAAILQQHAAQQEQQQQQKLEQQQAGGEADLGAPAPAAAPFQPDLAVVFASCNYGSQLQDVVRAVRRAAPSVKHVFGCTAFGVCGSSPGGPREVEGEPALSLSLAALPGVEVSLVHSLRSSLPSEDASPEAWADLVGLSPVEALTPSPHPSSTSSRDEADAGGSKAGSDDAAAGAAAAGDSSSSSSSGGAAQERPSPGGSSAAGPSSSDAASRALLQRSARMTAAAAAGGAGNGAGAAGPSSSGAVGLPAPAAAAPPPPAAAVSFLVLCDPRFQQVRQLLAGLDFAFPNSNKVGAVLSQGQANKRRHMFVWSADGAVRAGSTAWRRRTRQRRRQQQEQAQQAHAAASLRAAPGSSDRREEQAWDSEASPAAQEPKQEQQQQQEPDQEPQDPAPDGSSAKQQGSRRLFGGLFDSLLAGLADDDDGGDAGGARGGSRGQQGSNSRSRSKAGGPGARRSRGAAAGGYAAAAGSVPGSDSEGEDGEDDDDEEGIGDDESGVFMYGAAVLALKGSLALEPLTCQGYRTVSDKVWVVGETSREGDLIGSLIDPDSGHDGPGSSAGGRRSSGIQAADDSSSDDDDDEEGGSGQLVPLLAVYDLLSELGPDVDVSDLGGKLAVAIAPDAWSPLSALPPEAFTVAAISELWSEQGVIRIDGAARPGHRLKLVLRDEAGMRQDLRDRLLGLKRAELAGMLTGRPQPPPLAALLFSDIGRGSLLYGSPHYESGVVASYLPVPLGGALGAAQVSTVNGAGSLYEMSAVLGVLRLLPAAARRPGDQGGDGEQREADSEPQPWL